MADLWHTTSSGERINVTQERIKRDRRAERNAIINADKNSLSEHSFIPSFSMVTKILGLMALALLLVGIYRIAASGDEEASIPTFTELLNIIQGAPAIQIPMLGNMFSEWTGTVNWGYFYFLQVIFEFIGVIVDVWLFICNGMLSIYTYIYYFVVWIFV